MSKFSDEIAVCLKELFPELKIKMETFVNHNGQKLYLDFFIPQLNLIIEVHGRQHEVFVKHFHGDKSGFKKSKERDNTKLEWAQENNYTLVAVYEKDFPMTSEKLAKIIQEAV